jgi:hypothetical protein
MAHSITTRPRSDETLPSQAATIQLSGSLSRLVDGSRAYRDASGDGVAIAVGQPSGADIAEAFDKLAQAEAACRSARPGIIAQWCQLLTSLPWGPKTEEESRAAITAIILACGDMPAGVWTIETSTIALRTWKHWPAPAQVYELLKPIGKSITNMRDRLKAIATTSKEPARGENVADRSKTAIAHVRATVAAFVAERSFTQPKNSPAAKEVKAAPLSVGQLIASWEQIEKEGVPGAAERVAKLKEKEGFTHD